MTNWTRKLLRLMPVAAMCFLASSGASAEDIDIYAGPTTSDLPNVIIIWDSSANWDSDIPVPNCSYSDGTGGPKASSPNQEQGKKMAIEKCAIYNVIDALPVDPVTGAAKFNVALMLFNESPGAISGGYPRLRFLPMDAAGKAAWKFVIRNIGINADKGNNAAFSKSLYEAYLMFAKAVPYRGTAGTKWDPLAVANGHYVGPAGSGCGKNHIIFIANGRPGEITNADALARLGSLPPPSNNTAMINYPTSYITNSDQANWADEFARDLRTVDVSSKLGVQSITTHAIAVTGASSDGLYPNFIKAIATQGGGQYFAASDVNLLIKYLTDIFNSIQAVNSVFSAASLPISASVQGTFKSQVFVGLFRPDALARPRWFGNLKQYQVVYDPVTNTLQLGDSLGNGALNAGSGFFDPAAVSFWTTASSFWANDLKGTPPSASDRPDGEVAEKGGVAEVLRTTYATDQSARKVYTCIGCAANTTLSGGAATAFVDTNNAITQAMLGAADATERTNLINWIRGLDNNNDELGPGAPTTVRPSIHGDVLHSRAVVVDYGIGTGTITYYGGNEGMVHAIDGNQTGATAGKELWAFIPQEMFGSSVNQTCNNNTNTTYRFKRLRDNDPQIWFNTASTDASPSVPCLGTATRRDYGVDGAITAYQKLDNSGGVVQVVLYVSMRRGARALYALDVTNPNAPIYLWKILPSAIPALGQTWSEPRLTRIKGNTNPVLVFGAGYDAAAEDVIPPGATTMGNAILVLDAFTGSVVNPSNPLATDRSVPAAVTFLDTDYDGKTDRAYAVDLGGNVYRIDFEDASGTPAWAITKFAALGDAGNTRKFFYEPDAVQTANFVAVLVGTGNREHPLLSSTNDRFYTLFDYKMSKGAPASAPISETGLVPVANNFDVSTSPPGCYLALDIAGEKVVTASVTTGGNSYFATNMPTPPDPNSCSSNLGLARTYQMPLFCGIPVTQDLAGGGLPPTPVSGTVGVQIAGSGTNPATTKLVPFIIGGINPQLSGIGASRVPINVDPTRRRIYWFTNTGH